MHTYFTLMRGQRRRQLRAQEAYSRSDSIDLPPSLPSHRFPLYVLKPAIVESAPVWGHLVLRYVLIALLGVLQLLHVFWFSIIVKMIIKFARGEMEGDERSDDEEGDGEENEKED